MVAGIDIRRCGPSDVKVLAEISRRTFCEAFAHLNDEARVAAFIGSAYGEDRLLDELRAPHSRFYFITADGELAGYLKLNASPGQSDRNDPDSLEVERIYVDARYQSRGLGEALVDKAAEEAAALGKKYLWLGVWEHNKKAQRFYKRMGFYFIGEHGFDLGGEMQTDFVMRMDLD